MPDPPPEKPKREILNTLRALTQLLILVTVLIIAAMRFHTASANAPEVLSAMSDAQRAQLLLESQAANTDRLFDALFFLFIGIIAAERVGGLVKAYAEDEELAERRKKEAEQTAQRDRIEAS